MYAGHFSVCSDKCKVQQKTFLQFTKLCSSTVEFIAAEGYTQWNLEGWEEVGEEPKRLMPAPPKAAKRPSFFFWIWENMRSPVKTLGPCPVLVKHIFYFVSGICLLCGFACGLKFLFGIFIYIVAMTLNSVRWITEVSTRREAEAD